jgi:rubrerythrin
MDFWKGFGKQERYNCNSCWKLILAPKHPDFCPHCKTSGKNIIKLLPKVSQTPKKHS